MPTLSRLVLILTLAAPSLHATLKGKPAQRTGSLPAIKGATGAGATDLRPRPPLAAKAPENRSGPGTLRQGTRRSGEKENRPGAAVKLPALVPKPGTGTAKAKAPGTAPGRRLSAILEQALGDSIPEVHSRPASPVRRRPAGSVPVGATAEGMLAAAGRGRSIYTMATGRPVAVPCLDLGNLLTGREPGSAAATVPLALVRVQAPGPGGAGDKPVRLASFQLRNSTGQTLRFGPAAEEGGGERPTQVCRLSGADGPRTSRASGDGHHDLAGGETIQVTLDAAGTAVRYPIVDASGSGLLILEFEFL